ncbi:MAG: hypothetical protein ACFFD4_37545, partial [Candidatus Odinarchaeota archaeon]
MIEELVTQLKEKIGSLTSSFELLLKIKEFPDTTQRIESFFACRRLRKEFELDDFIIKEIFNDQLKLINWVKYSLIIDYSDKSVIHSLYLAFQEHSYDFTLNKFCKHLKNEKCSLKNNNTLCDYVTDTRCEDISFPSLYFTLFSVKCPNCQFVQVLGFLDIATSDRNL